MLKGFEDAVQTPTGTAYGAFTGFPLSTFPLAGKTGTATTNEQQPNSWFVGWGPEPDPQYLIAVVVEGGGYGASAAAPVARQGFDYIVAHPESPVKLAAPSTTSSSTPTTATTTSTTTPTTTTGARAVAAARHRPCSLAPRPGSRLSGEMTSLWPRIEPLLAQVEKPARYIGGELGSQQPEHGPGRVAWLLIYPDTYEIGLPNQGLQILYEILNERPDAVAERAYAPWTDMEAAMRAAGVPLFSLEGNLAAGDFDVLAFNLSAELTYTNLLNLVDLSGVPVRSCRADRRPSACDRRWALRVQPRALGRLRRRLRPR